MDKQNVYERAAAMRAAFDQSFAQEPQLDREARQNYLCIRCGGDAYAVDMREIAGLHEGKQVRPLPGPLTQLRGIAGFRGALVPVYDLAALLGYARPAGRPRWMMLADSTQRFALAFDELEDYLQIDDAAAFTAADGAAAQRAYVRGSVSDAGMPRALLDIAALAKAIGNLVEAS